MDLESKYCYFYHSWDFVPLFGQAEIEKNRLLENYFSIVMLNKESGSFFVLLGKLVNISMFPKGNMGRSPNYGRNSNILIPDPYH
jgi:hypothetical protein